MGDPERHTDAEELPREETEREMREAARQKITDAEIEAALQAVKYPNGPEDKLIGKYDFTWDTLKDFASKTEWPLSSKLAKCLIEMGALCERLVEEATFWKLLDDKRKET